jgi:hypothetical protein
VAYGMIMVEANLRQEVLEGANAPTSVTLHNELSSLQRCHFAQNCITLLRVVYHLS